MNILELLKSGEKTALIQNGRSVSYDALLERGLRFGALLRDSGIKEGGNVLIFIPLSIALYTSMIGAWAIGAVPIFIDFSRGARFVNDSIDRLKPDLIICDNITATVRLRYTNMKKVKMIKSNKTAPSRADIEKLGDDHPAILTFTSGTTGQPKIAVRTHGFLINQYHVLKKHLDFDKKHIDFGTLPIFTLANMAAGMTTLLPNKSYKGIKLPGNLDKITRAICSPAIFKRMTAVSEMPSLKQLYLGGAPVYPSLLGELRSDIDTCIVYGSTEAEPIASVKWSEVSAGDRAKIAGGAGLLAGEIVPDIELKITGENEIIVCGSTVLGGYLGGVGDSENKIKDGEKIWHRTGDSGYLDEQGRLWLTGRISQTILDGAGVLHPFNVECVLDASFGIRGAVLLHNGKRTVVIDKDVDASKVLEPLGIEQIIKIKKLPMDKRHNAKIDYSELKKILYTNSRL